MSRLYFENESFKENTSNAILTSALKKPKLSTEAASQPQKSSQDKKIPDLASAISLDKKSWKTGHPGNPANDRGF